MSVQNFFVDLCQRLKIIISQTLCQNQFLQASGDGTFVNLKHCGLVWNIVKH